MFSNNNHHNNNNNNNNIDNNNKNLGINYIKCPMDLIPHTEMAEQEVNTVLLMAQNANVRRAPITKIFIDDLTERRRLWRVPWFIVTVCILQISFYVVANDCMSARLMFTAMPMHQREYWRYLTYMLLHADRQQLLLNIMLQCLVGFLLEYEQGGWRVALVYAVGGISGSVTMALLQPTLSLIGASAGVYALLLSHVPHLLKNFSQISLRYLRIVALIILCLSDVIFTTFHFITNGNANPRICLEAHIAGALSGLCLGLLFYKRLNRSGLHHRASGCC